MIVKQCFGTFRWWSTCGPEVVLCGPRCNEFVGRLFKFLVFFTGSSMFAIKTHQYYTCCFCYGPTTENLCNKRFENMSIFKIWFTSTQAQKLAILRATYHLVLPHKTYQNQGICYIILCYHFYCVRKLVSCLTHPVLRKSRYMKQKEKITHCC